MNHPGTQTPEPVAIVIIGATGDLSQRLLFPALYRLFSEGAIAGSLAIVGMSRRGMTHEQFRTFVREGVHGDVAIDAAGWGRFADRLFYVSADSMKEADYAHVARTLAEVEPRFGTGGNRLLYPAAPPPPHQTILPHPGGGEVIPDGSGPPPAPGIIEQPVGPGRGAARPVRA